jgi:hypothetical protein
MKITTYLSAALLGIALSAPAQSTIAYFDGPAFHITLDTTPSIDFGWPGQGDIAFGCVFFSPNIDTNSTGLTNVQSSGITGEYYVAPLDSNNVLCTNYDVLIMPAGTLIGAVTSSNVEWSASEGATLVSEFIAFGNPPVTSWYGTLAARPEAGFLGVRLQVQNEWHYGWVQAQLQTNAASGDIGPIIVDWAYETRPNTFIVAGAKPVPVPLAAPRVVQPGTLRLAWQSIIGQSYQVQFKSQLDTPLWTNLNAPITSSGTNLIANLPITGVSGFYRVVQAN